MFVKCPCLEIKLYFTYIAIILFIITFCADNNLLLRPQSGHDVQILHWLCLLTKWAENQIFVMQYAKFKNF